MEAEDAPLAQKAMEGIRKVQQGIISSFTMEYPCHAPQKQRWFRMKVIKLAGDSKGKTLVIHENITEQKLLEQKLLEQNNILEGINELQLNFIEDTNTSDIFSRMLSLALKVSEASKGFLGEIKHTSQKHPTLNIHAHANLQQENTAFNKAMDIEKIIIQPSDNILYKAYQLKTPVIKNNPEISERKMGLPPNYPSINNFILIPVLREYKVIGMLGLANKLNGFDRQNHKALKPVVSSLSNLIYARTRQEELTKTQSALRDSEARNKSLLAAIPDLIFVFDKDDVFIDCHLPDGAATILTKETFMHKRIQDVLPEHIVKEHKNARAIVQEKGKTHSYTYSVNMPSKGNLLYESTMVPYTCDSVLAIVKDITHQQKTRELEQQIEFAKKEARFKQNFLATMSHEIRTPLTGVIGMAEILSRTELSTTQKDYVATLLDSGENLRNIINLVLDYSKLEAGEMPVSPRLFNFKQFAENTAMLYRSLCKPRVTFSISTHPDIPTYLIADQPKINQITGNLLSNAIKFTPVGSIQMNAYIENTLTEFDDKNTILIGIEVRDTGFGISRENMSTLFHPFRQVKEHHQAIAQGTGLGLSICKQLTELLGGTIWVESKEGKGSSFKFSFRATIPKQHEIEALDAKNNENKKIVVQKRKTLNILVAEDLPVNRKVLEIMLGFLGHSVTFAYNGKQILEIYKQGMFDLILMDIQMPVMDGLTATKELKKQYTYLPPIVGLSANALEGDREKYMAEGMDEYLAKPIKSDDFTKLISKLFY